MPKETRQERISRCGKREALYINKSTGSLSIKKLYCGVYYGDEPCENCLGYEKHSRRIAVEHNTLQYNTLFMAALHGNDWAAIRKQLHRVGASGIRVPQSDSMMLIYSTKNPYDKKDLFVPVAGHEATTELTRDENLFCKFGKRSVFGDWSLTDDDIDDSDSIEIQTVLPAFDGDVTQGWLNQTFALHATTWTGGTVSLSNVQEFYNFVINKGMELAILQGRKWDINGTRVQKLVVTEKMISNWGAASVDEPNLQVQGRPRIDKRYQLEINAIKPFDYVSMYLKMDKIDKDKATLGDGYSLFYNEDGTEKEFGGA